MKTCFVLLTVFVLSVFVLFHANSAYGKPAESSATCFGFFNNDAQVTSLALTNIAELPITYTLTIFDSAGTQAAPAQNGNLAASATVSLIASQSGSLGSETYHALIESGGELAGAAYVKDLESGAVGAYKGVPCSGNQVQYFGPFYMNADGDIRNSVLRLAGSPSSGGTVSVEFRNLNGTVAHAMTSILLPPNGWVDLDSRQLAGMFSLVDGVGTVRVQVSSGGFSGMLRLQGKVGDYIYQNGVDSPSAFMARAVSRIYLPYTPKPSEAARPRYTKMFLISTDDSTQTVNVSYYRPDGTQAQQPTVKVLSPASAFENDLGAEGSHTTSVNSIVVGGQGSLGVFSYSYPAGPADDLSSDSYFYQVNSGAIQNTLPLMRSDTISPVLTVQNTSGTATNVAVEFVAANGTDVVTINSSQLLPPGAAAVFNVGDYPNIPIDFVGSAITRATTAGGEVTTWIHVYAKRNLRMLYLPLALK